MVLAMLTYIESILAESKIAVDYYNDQFITGEIQTLKIREHTDWNCSYYPVVFKSEATLIKVQKALNIENIFPRRYFYPALNTLDYVTYQQMPVAESVAERIMCLPLYVGLTENELERICKIITCLSC
jgi:dTDP-4-amino-4,6-dideoxygalactose transaminase